MISPKRLLLLPALAVALTGAGCGGDDDFVEGYNAATAPLTELMTDLGGTNIAAGGDASAQAEKQLTKLADGLEDVEGRLRELDPPSDAEAEFDAMLASLDENTQQVRKMAKAMKSGNIERISAAANEFSTKGNELVQAENALRTAVNG